MATAGFIVDVDNLGDSDPSTPSPTLPYSAVLHPLLAPAVSSVATAQKPRSRQAVTHVNPLQTTHGYSRRATYVRLLSNHLAKGCESEHVRLTGVKRILIDHLHQCGPKRSPGAISVGVEGRHCRY